MRIKQYPTYTTRYMVGGSIQQSCDYGWDIGSLHVIDYYLHIEAKLATALFMSSQPYISALRIGRYLDGEEEQEGLYR